MTPEDTFNSLVQKHDAALRRIALVYAGRDGEEEDLYQETLAQVWKSLPSFRGDASAGTWIYRVALNTALTWRRRETRRDRARSALDSQTAVSTTLIPRSARPQSAILGEFLDGLSGPDHSVLLLYMEGLSHQEIAEVIGTSTGAVSVRLHRIKRVYTERYLEN